MQFSGFIQKQASDKQTHTYDLTSLIPTNENVEHEGQKVIM